MQLTVAQGMHEADTDPTPLLTDADMACFGPAWCGDELLRTDKDTKVAEYAAAAQGHHVEVFYTGTPVWHFKIHARQHEGAGDVSMFLRTDRDTRLAAEVAQLLAQGVLRGPSWCRRTLQAHRGSLKRVDRFGGRGERKVEMLVVPDLRPWLLLKAPAAKGKVCKCEVELGLPEGLSEVGRRLAQRLSSERLQLITWG